jgi:hypothetical protein
MGDLCKCCCYQGNLESLNPDNKDIKQPKVIVMPGVTRWLKKNKKKQTKRKG